MPRHPRPAGQLARQLATLKPHPFIDAPFRWGTIAATHIAGTTTLSAAITSVPTFTFTTAGDAGVNSFIFVGTMTMGIQVVGVSGTGPYTTTTKQPVTSTQTNGATVRIVSTVDVYMDGNSPSTGPNLNAKPHIGMRYLSTYSPTIGDQVLVGHGHASDFWVFGKLA